MPYPKMTGWLVYKMSPCGPSLPRRPRASVSVIRRLAAALVPWPARQLMTHHVDLLRNFVQRSTLNRTASPDL